MMVLRKKKKYTNTIYLIHQGFQRGYTAMKMLNPFRYRSFDILFYVYKRIFNKLSLGYKISLTKIPEI